MLDLLSSVLRGHIPTKMVQLYANHVRLGNTIQEPGLENAQIVLWARITVALWQLHAICVHQGNMATKMVQLHVNHVHRGNTMQKRGLKNAQIVLWARITVALWQLHAICVHQGNMATKMVQLHVNHVHRGNTMQKRGLKNAQIVLWARITVALWQRHAIGVLQGHMATKQEH